MGYAFISYSTKDQQSADAIRQLFMKNRIDVWMAPYNIPADGKYAAAITKAIRDCSCFVLLLSEASQSSEAVDSEVQLAAITYKKTVITVQLEDVVLNDAFTFYILNKQIVPVHQINESSDEIRKVLKSVLDYAGQLECVEEDSDILLDSKLGQITIDKRYLLSVSETIGKSGYGTLFLAEDTDSGKKCFIEYGGHCPERMRIQLPDICKKIIKIHNDNICAVYNAKFSPFRYYIVKEYIENGCLLSDLIVNNNHTSKSWTLEQKLSIIINILKGVQALHGNGIVLLNMTPSNIITNGNTTKIIDFSSANYLNEISDKVDFPDLEYFSPEATHDRKSADERADLFSIGMIAFEWICGSFPFQYENSEALRFDHINENIDSKVIGILAKAIKKDPIKRYQTADEFISALNLYKEAL